MTAESRDRSHNGNWVERRTEQKEPRRRTSRRNQRKRAQKRNKQRGTKKKKNHPLVSREN